MNRRNMALLLGLLLILAPAAPSGAAKPAQYWDGGHWAEMNPQAKITFVAGVCNMADALAGEKGTDRASCIIRAFSEELTKKTLGQVVEEVDKYYKDNPDKKGTTVINVILLKATKLCAPPQVAAEKK